jgi:hypothetical protein
VGSTLQVDLQPGQATFLDLPGSTVVSGLGQRAEVQPVFTPSFPPDPCVVSAEVYVNGLGTTAAYFPPGPCSPSSASCVAF